MKLSSLVLYNFRQFYSLSPRIEFSQSEKKNITVILGNNGAGKTALLNSLTWLLYEKFTNALGAPQQLINKRAIREAKAGGIVECWVELHFEHYGRKYRLKRTMQATKISESNDVRYSEGSLVKLEWSAENGKWKVVDFVNDAIGRILPEQLHAYFFFDGERIEVLQRPDKKDEITSATSKLIGDEVLSRSIDHLDRARKKLELELKDIGDLETKSMVDKKIELENEKDRLEQLQAERKLNMEGFKHRKGIIEEKLRGLQAVKSLQERRDYINTEQVTIENNLSQIRDELGEMISKKGFLAFSTKAFVEFWDVTEGLRSKGNLPSAIKSYFIQDLLDQKMCICKRKLHPGDEAYTNVLHWKDQCVFSDVEEIVFKMESEVKRLEEDIPTLYEMIEKEQSKREDYRSKLSRIETELDDIREKLKGSEDEEPRKLQEEIDEIDQKVELLIGEHASGKIRINEIIKDIESVDDEIKKREGLDDKQKLAKRRVESCLEAKNRIEMVQSRLRSHFRDDLAERIQRIFSSISFKPYFPVIGEDYSLTLMDGVNSSVPVGASTGENQILSLSFIGALIEQAKEFSAKRDRLPGPDSSAFPMVMDSAFGNLDPIYRRQIATRIPELANQVIVMVSRSQWDDEVETAMTPRIGKQYVLTYYSTKDDVEEDSVDINGIKFDLVKKSFDEFESSEITEVINRV